MRTRGEKGIGLALPGRSDLEPWTAEAVHIIADIAFKAKVQSERLLQPYVQGYVYARNEGAVETLSRGPLAAPTWAKMNVMFCDYTS